MRAAPKELYPLFYEDAAHLLNKLMCRGVLSLDRPAGVHVLIYKAAAHFAAFLRDRLTHAEAAIRLLDDLTCCKIASCPAANRDKAIGMIGTMIAVVATAQNHKRR